MGSLSGNCSDSAPVPAPRLKKKHKLSFNSNEICIDKSTEIDIPKIIPRRRRNRSKPVMQLEIVINDCCKDKKCEESNIIDIVTTAESASLMIEDSSLCDIEISHEIKDSEYAIKYFISENFKPSESNSSPLRFEEQSQDDSGVYLPEGISSGHNFPESEKHDDAVKVNLGNIITPNTLHFNIEHLLLSNSFMPLMKDVPEINMARDVRSLMNTGSLMNCQTDVPNTGDDHLKLLDETVASVSNINLSKTSVPLMDDSDVLEENVEEIIQDTVERINQYFDCNETQKILYTEDSDSSVRFSVQLDHVSGDVHNIFLENFEHTSFRPSSYDNAIHFMLPEEPVPVIKTLQNIESSISISPSHFNSIIDRIEEITVLPDFRHDDFSLLASKLDQTSSLIIEDVTEINSQDSYRSVTDTISNVTTAEKVLENETNTKKDCCLHSALENFGAFTVKENRKQMTAIENEGQLKVDKENNTCEKRYNYKTYRSSAEVHPTKISGSLDLFLKNMLMDNEEYDLNYKLDNNGSSNTFNCDLNQTFNNAISEVTNLTEKTNRELICLGLNKEVFIDLPVDREAPPRCITVESSTEAGLMCDNVNNNSDVCNQLICDSEVASNCELSVVNVDTIIPSSIKNCQPSEHAEHQFFVNSSRGENVNKSEGIAEYISRDEKDGESYEDRVKKGDKDSIKRYKDSSITVNECDNLPSSENVDTIVKPFIPLNKLSLNPRIPALVNTKGKELKKNLVNDSYMDNLSLKTEYYSDFINCDRENNNNIKNISSERKESLVPDIEQEIENPDNKNACPSGEYHVTLEKLWGTFGLKIEVCINHWPSKTYSCSIMVKWLIYMYCKHEPL